MASVIGVHGISQQQLGKEQLRGKWEAALLDGIDAVDESEPITPELAIAYYGRLFLTRADQGMERSDAKGGMISDDPEELAKDLSADEEAQDYLAAIGESVVPEGFEPDTTKGGAFRSLPPSLSRLAGWLDDAFGAAAPLLFFADFRQVRLYQHDDDLARQARDGVEQELKRTGAKVLIGHSLGSVVAYETLALLSAHGVSTLVTIGCPLGLRTIQDELRAEERRLPGVKRWVSVRDIRDPITCGGPLKPRWNDVVEREVKNGNEPHGATRYLGKWAVGEAVLAGLADA